MSKVDYDNKEFFEAVKLLHEYKVGDEFFVLRDNKIIPVTLYEVALSYYDHGLTNKAERKYSVKTNFVFLNSGGSKFSCLPTEAYRTREEAAEAFLERNDIPKKLLMDLVETKPQATVEKLIERLKLLDPETNLGSSFPKILKEIQEAYLNEIGEGSLIFKEADIVNNVIDSNKNINFVTSPKVILEVTSPDKTYSPDKGFSVDSKKGNMGIGTPVSKVDITLDYWDCKCEKEYIHTITDDECPVCKARREDMPNSIKSEVVTENMYKHKV